MAIESWIDDIVDLWKGINDPKGGNVKGYYVFRKGERPDVITDYPCAITYWPSVRNEYSLGGPLVSHYIGLTEFHLSPDVGGKHDPYIVRFYDLILFAAASSMTLGGKVEMFHLTEEETSLEPVIGSYGDESPHPIMRVTWRVKENRSGEFSPSA